MSVDKSAADAVNNRLADFPVGSTGAEQFLQIKSAAVVETCFQHSGRSNAHLVAGAAELPGIALNKSQPAHVSWVGENTGGRRRSGFGLFQLGKNPMQAGNKIAVVDFPGSFGAGKRHCFNKPQGDRILLCQPGQSDYFIVAGILKDHAVDFKRYLPGQGTVQRLQDRIKVVTPGDSRKTLGIKGVKTQVQPVNTNIF